MKKEERNKTKFIQIGQKIVGIFTGLLLILLLFNAQVSAQDAKDTADKALKSSGRVNPSTLAMELDIPLGSYPGRGINVPVSISYSSKVWRMNTDEMLSTSLGGAACKTYSSPRFSEDSKSGWTTSLDVPVVEYTGWIDLFDTNGFPVIERLCENQPPPPISIPIRRITIRMPSGETHELRMDNAYSSGNTGKNGYFYASDGSNLIYYENSATNTYKLLMPDGSFYEFENFSQNSTQNAPRKGIKFTDRNGNYTSFNTTNGQWTDTLGRTLESPLKDASEGIKTYQMPGMTGTYKFHWEKLEDSLTDPNATLKYPGDTYNGTPPQYFIKRPASQTLFQSNSEWDNRVTDSYALFNPVVLTKIELPNGQVYEFSYDVFGQIDKIKYPTGGEETFTYQAVKPLTRLIQPWNDVSSQTNRGVSTRVLYESSGSNTNYTWTYSTDYVAPKGYKVSITNPEGILTERFLHRGEEDCFGCPFGNFGFSDILVGREYETRVFDTADRMVSRHLTNWTKTSYSIGNGTADWHPRITHEETHIYEPNGNGDRVWQTVKYEYEDLSTIDKPLLRKKVSQYEYEASAGSSSLAPEDPGDDPDPNPTPVPTPTPPNLIRTAETTYLIYDTSISQTTRDIYRNQNMIGLATASVVKDSAGNVVSRSEMKYDESGYSPAVGRGNPTTSRVWDSTKGAYTNSSAYISTRAKFDTYGNQIESYDALNNKTTTEYDTTYQAYPIKVTSAIPDSTGTNGSNTAFVTETTYNTTTGLPLTTKDVNGQITTFEYDAVTLRPKKVIPPSGGSIVETIYDDVNRKVTNKAQIDANNWTESITYYDGLGRSYKAEQVHSDGNIFVEKEFDADGRVKRVSNPYRTGETKLWTENVYDEASRVIEVILPDGAKVKTDYGVSITGKIGTTKQITDQAGKKRKGINDVLGRMIRVIEDPTGQALETDYVFDTLGNLRKTIQGEQSRYFMHDSLGRLLYSKQPEEEANTNFVATDAITGNTAWSNKYEYDDNGNITSTTNARNVSVTATYDKFNRIILRNYSDATPDVNFFYDGTGLGAVPNYSKGKTTKVLSSVSETRYTSFDNLGRLLTHEQRTTEGQIAGTENAYQTAYTYNLSGAILTETYPSGRVLTYDYRQDGELDKVSGVKAGQSSSYTYLNNIEYDTLGNVEKLRLGNGTWESAEYNDRQQVSQIALGHSNTDKSLLKIDYAYGTNTQNNGSLRQQTISYYGLSNSIIQDYTYDDLNRLKSSTETANNVQSWKQTFNYDRFGNRTFDATNTTTLAQNNKVTNPTIETANNRLKKDQDNDSVNDYDYDKTGNVTLDAENKRFIYDAENRIKEFFKGTNSSSTPDAKYEYDGDGKRVRKIDGTIETIFVYNASGQLVAEYSNQMPQNPKISYLTTDHLGSPRIATDGMGTVVSRHDYLAFGDEVTDTVGNVAGRTTAQGYGNEDEIRQGYTGYENDKESGLDYAQARYYNSSHGRFTSVDPLTASANVKNPQTFNRYSYVLNSPYKFTDPLGLLAQGVNYGEGCGAEYGSCTEGTRELEPEFEATAGDAEGGGSNSSASNGNRQEEAGGQQAEGAERPPKVETFCGGEISCGNAEAEELEKKLAKAQSDEERIAILVEYNGNKADVDEYQYLLYYQETIAPSSVENIVYAGHGLFDKEDGNNLTTVPDGVWITFYAKVGTPLYDLHGQRIDRAIGKKEGDIGDLYKITLGPGAIVPNLTILYPDGLSIIPEAKRVNTPTNISEIMSGYKGKNVNLHISACFTYGTNIHKRK